MKKLIKDKRIFAIIGSVAALAIMITLVLFLPRNDNSPPIDSTQNTSSPASDTSITVEIPDDSEIPNASEESTGNDIKDNGTGLQPDENISVDSGKPTTGEKVQDTVPAVKEAVPPENTDKPNNGGVQIGDGNNIKKYICGSPNHKCEGPETHSFILNLEIEGCSYCGSHSCPSFYATDEWGNACYTPSKCPEYDIKKDAAEYCQVCGRKNGNGDNDTCQKWIIDFTCPTCGEIVKANKCHTH